MSTLLPSCQSSRLRTIRCRVFSRRNALVCALALAGTTTLHAEKLVTVLSLADADYTKQRAASKPARVDSYVLAKGQHSTGNDSDLRKVDFNTIASTLAVDLKKQRFDPAPTAEKADLIIIVHWGITADNDKGITQTLYDPDAMRTAQEAVTTARNKEEADLSWAAKVSGEAAAAEANLNTERQVVQSLYGSNDLLASSNAELLGFRAALRKDDETAETVRSMLDEARYFIILTAYDGPALRTGKKHPLWTTRMSIRAAGVNFLTALNRMSSVAAKSNGTQPTELVLEDAKDRAPIVKIGEIKIIGDASEKSPKAKP